MTECFKAGLHIASKRLENPLASTLLIVVLLVFQVDCLHHSRLQTNAASACLVFHKMAQQEAGNHGEPSTAPIYITVGPQCCGKTTWIQRQEKSGSGEILDISLDDGRDVYIPVPTRCLLNIEDTVKNNTETEKERDDDRKILKRMLHGKSLMERIQSDNLELRLVLQRWTGKLSEEDFKLAMTKHLGTAANDDPNSEKISSESIENWIATVEDFLGGSSNHTPPDETMIFCVESLFRPHPETNRSAIQMATELLHKTGESSQRIGKNTKKGAVAWGNTNSKPRDYVVALECAAAQHRPVYFVREEKCLDDSNRGANPNMSSTDRRSNKEGINSVGTETMMPRASLRTLWLRNLHRYAKTGRFIPANSMELCRHRVDHLLDQAYQNALAKHSTGRNIDGSRDESGRRNDEFELSVDQALVSLAGTRDFRFIMDHNRRIIKEYYTRNQHGGRRFGGRDDWQRGARNYRASRTSNRQTNHGQHRNEYDGIKRSQQSEQGQWRPRQRPRWDDGRNRDNPGNTYGGRSGGRGLSSRYGGSAGRHAG